LLALFGLVDAERPPIERRAVHLGDGLGSLVRIAHRHERETAGLPGLTVGREVNLAHLAERGEGGANRFDSRPERKISNVQTVSHGVLASAGGSTSK
jgi:hypothetical protein